MRGGGCTGSGPNPGGAEVNRLGGGIWMMGYDEMYGIINDDSEDDDEDNDEVSQSGVQSTTGDERDFTHNG